MTKETGTPQIRFSGYNDTWEQRKFEQGMDLLTGYPFESEKFSEEGIKLVRGMNVKRGYLDFSADICMKWNTADGLEKYLLCDDDILIQMDGALIGKSYAKIKKNQLPALLVQRVTRARAIKGIADSNFMYQCIQRDFLKYIQMSKTDSAVPHLSLNDIRDFKIMVPSFTEQQKVGKYFENLDNLITLHQRKYDKLVKVKKSMLKKMFPREGAKVPEIRFYGFTDDWEQRKLGDIADVTKLAGFEFTEHVVYSDEGSIIALRGLNIKNGQLVLDDVKYIDGSNFAKLNRSKLFIDDIMFTYVGTVGEVAIIKENDRFYLAPNVSRIRVQSNDSPKFISHYMRTDSFYRQVIFPLIATSSQPALSMENIRKFEICLPKNRDEQDKLSEFFDGIDNLITLHQRKLEKLKNLKKACLKKMFI